MMATRNTAAALAVYGNHAGAAFRKVQAIKRSMVAVDVEAD